MLLRVSIENFLSFNENVEFSMIAGRTRILPDHVIKGEKRNDVNILKSGVLLGANASGKSNFVKAIDFAKKFVTQELTQKKGIPLYTFKLNLEAAKMNTKFEFEIKCGHQMYAYGFTLNSQIVVDEWLYEVGKVKEKKIFERKTLQDEILIDLSNIRFEKNADLERLNYIAKDTRTNRLFLTELNSRNVQSINNIQAFTQTYQWFEEKLEVMFPNSRHSGLEFKIGSNNSFTEVFSSFLDSFDTGIRAISLEEIDFEHDVLSLTPDVKDDIANVLLEGTETFISTPNDYESYLLQKDDNAIIKAYKLMTKHYSQHGGEDILFDLHEESDGTRRLFDLIPALIDMTSQDKVYFIDELDRNLHPNLTQKILKFFLEKTKSQESQLIVTTHESSLLDLNFLRRDEIWFVEKNQQGESVLYSLEEFQPRYDKEIRKGYLQGRFGAIPLMKNLNDFPS